ncbi:polysaccharide deacetylase family protein [Acidobacteriota bacterium]
MTSKHDKQLASLSMDLDNQWSYMKIHGDPGWESFPSYFDILIPLILDLLDELNLKITFFVVGRDAILEKNKEPLAHLKDKGFEIGNHSFSHEPWFRSDSITRIEREVLKAEEAITTLFGQKPLGFRGPGFTWDRQIIKILKENGYIYDASVLPTYFGPLARSYYFWKSNLSSEEKQKRTDLYGSLKDGFWPLKPYLWQMESNETLLEVPITTMPFFRIPCHLSYLLYIGRFSQALMLTYLKSVIALCHLTKTSLSFLLHPLDFLDLDIAPELSFFPAMDLKMERKIHLFKKVIEVLSYHYSLVDMNTHAIALLEEKKLKKIEVHNG